MTTTDSPRTSVPSIDTRNARTKADAAAAAKAWVAAKEAEKAAEKALNEAKADRAQAVEALQAAGVQHGDTVTVNGNARYTFTVSPRTRFKEGAALKAVQVKHPETVETVKGFKADPEYQTPFTVYTLKRERV